MDKVDIPFLPEWEVLMLTRKKSATSRTKRYGWPGDYFEAFGRTFILTSVVRKPLDHIAYYHYLEEGCNSNFEFKKIWERLHPRKGFVPGQKVYLHQFRLQGDLCIFHVHELTAISGVCQICGCDPTPIESVMANLTER